MFSFFGFGSEVGHDGGCVLRPLKDSLRTTFKRLSSTLCEALPPSKNYMSCSIVRERSERNPQKTFLSCFQNYRSWYTRHKRTHSCFIPPRVNKFLFCYIPILRPKNHPSPARENSERFPKSKGNHSHTAAHDSNSNSLYECAPANTLSSTTPINEEENYRLKFVCCFSPLKAAPPKNNCAWGEIMMIIWRSVNNNSKAFSPLHIRRKLFMSFIIVLSHSTFIIILSA